MVARALASSPWRRHRAPLLWGGYALALLLAPLVWHSSFALGLLSQMGIAIIACLAYNLLLGEGGMLSFGHAVYSGVGSFLAMHTLKLVGAGALGLPVSLIPLVGALAGAVLAALLGWPSTRHSGTPFAMITLGVGELVWALALMLPEVFGGEAGLSGNRVVAPPVLGISFGPPVQVYGLIAAYCFVSTALLYGLTRTPLGRLLNAARDNPERLAFVGYNPQTVRYLAFVISGAFSGLAGGLAALNFEIVTTEVLGTARSGATLLFVVLGGSTVFVGPMLGAVLMVLSLVLLSAWTPAWLLYLGLAFVLTVLYAPGGLAGLLLVPARLAGHGGRWRLLRRLLPAGLAWLLSALAALAAASALIEMAYQRQLGAALGTTLRWLGLRLDSAAVSHWLGALALLLVAGTLAANSRRRLLRQWRQRVAEGPPPGSGRPPASPSPTGRTTR